MANELRHKDIGSELTKAEFEDVTLHQLDSQAAGDLIKAISATQLSRLPKGNDDEVLTMVSGVPAWAAAAGGVSFTELAGGEVHQTSNGWTWQDWDISGIVPAGTKSVLVAIHGSSNSDAGHGVRKNGSALTRYAEAMPIGAYSTSVWLTEVDANRVIECYRRSNTATDAKFSILGYWS